MKTVKANMKSNAVLNEKQWMKSFNDTREAELWALKAGNVGSFSCLVNDEKITLATFGMKGNISVTNPCGARVAVFF